VDVVTTMLDESIPADHERVRRVGQPEGEEILRLHAGVSPYDNLGAHDYPALFIHSGSGTARCSTSSRPSTSRACARGAPGTASWSCVPTWRRAMAASPGVTSIPRVREQYAFILDQAGITN
jgi:hypothetical protein